MGKSKRLKKTLTIQFQGYAIHTLDLIVKSLTIDLQSIIKVNQLDTPEQVNFALTIFNRIREEWWAEISRVIRTFVRDLENCENQDDIRNVGEKTLKELRELPIKACMPRNVNYVAMEETLGYAEPWPKFWLSLNWDEE